MKRILLFLSILLLVGGTTMAFANGANGSDLTRVSNNENSASATDVVQPQNSNSSVKPLETTNNEPVITFTTSKKIGQKIKLTSLHEIPLSTGLKIEGATLVNGSSNSYVLTAQTVKIIGDCTSLDCSENDITSIDLSNNSGLTELYCYSNQLTSLDLSNNSALTYLSCGSNQLTSLDLSKNSKLTELDCNSNQLTSLDLSKNSGLTFLYCSSNQLTSLDLSKNSGLTYLDCSSNQFTSLDLSKNSKLTELYCDHNQLTSLKLPKDAEKLSEINCMANNIDVEHMEQLINSLPERTGYRYKDGFYSLDVQYSSTDGNQITAEQEQRAKDKGWSIGYIYKYTTPTGISTIDNNEALPRKVYDLNGCEVNENQAKGVVIVKQGNKTYKKVVK